MITHKASYKIETIYSETDIYLNITITNKTFPLTNEKTIDTSFSETRNQALLETPSDYQLSVVRFKLSQSSLPILNMDIRGFPNTNPLQSIYSFTLDHDGDIFQQYVVNIPQDEFISPPQTVTANNPNWDINGYNFVYDQLHLMRIFNIALEAAYNGLSSPPSGSQAPRIIYNSETELWEFVVQRNFYDINLPDAQRIDIYMNAEMVYTFMSAFGEIELTDNNTYSPDGRDFRLIVSEDSANLYQPLCEPLMSRVISTSIPASSSPQTLAIPTGHTFSIGDLVRIYNSNTIPPIDGVHAITSVTINSISIATGITVTSGGGSGVIVAQCNYYKITQAYNVNYINAFVENIYFTSSNLPVVNEYLGEGNINDQSNGIPIFNQIITDLSPSYASSGDNRGSLIYNPSGEYRLINMNSQQPLTKIDVNVRYRSRNGNTYPVKLAKGQSCNLKILFRKKTKQHVEED